MRHLIPLFVSKASAYKNIAKMLDRKEIKYEKIVRQKNGRPYRAFCNWKVPDDLWFHEMMLSDVLLHYLGRCARGENVDQELKPDAELLVDGILHYIEMHTGTMRGRKIEERISIYEPVSNPVLWICMSKKQRESLMKRTSNPNFYFGVYGEIMADPSCAWWNHKKRGYLPVRNPK